MQRLYILLFTLLFLCLGCQWHLRPSNAEDKARSVSIERYDRVESLYLCEADFAALQQMKTLYPSETRTLIEDVLRLGPVDATDINTRFLLFFQDSTLQTLLADVGREYATIDDLERDLTAAFKRLEKLLPDIELPRVYTQIGSLDQSVIVSKGSLGICLDKYLGEEYPLYLRYGYTPEQRSMMTRQFIVPDCMGFFLLSQYPLPQDTSIEARHTHMGKIQHVVNRVLGRRLFNNEYVDEADRHLNGLKGEELKKALL